MTELGLTAHDHGHCERCDALMVELETLRLDHHRQQAEIASLREMIPLMRSRVNAFLQWFETTTEGIH